MSTIWNNCIFRFNSIEYKSGSKYIIIFEGTMSTGGTTTSVEFELNGSSIHYTKGFIHEWMEHKFVEYLANEFNKHWMNNYFQLSKNKLLSSEICYRYRNLDANNYEIVLC